MGIGTAKVNLPTKCELYIIRHLSQEHSESSHHLFHIVDIKVYEKVSFQSRKMNGFTTGWIISSLMDTTVINALLAIFIPLESSLHRASNDEFTFIVL